MVDRKTLVRNIWLKYAVPVLLIVPIVLRIGERFPQLNQETTWWIILGLTLGLMGKALTEVSEKLAS